MGAALPDPVPVDQVLLELSSAAYAPHATAEARARLQRAVLKVLRLGRLHGLAAVPQMPRAEAADTFRQALRIAIASNVPRTELVAIFNGEDDER